MSGFEYERFKMKPLILDRSYANMSGLGGNLVCSARPQNRQRLQWVPGPFAALPAAAAAAASARGRGGVNVRAAAQASPQPARRGRAVDVRAPP